MDLHRYFRPESLARVPSAKRLALRMNNCYYTVLQIKITKSCDAEVLWALLLSRSCSHYCEFVIPTYAPTTASCLWSLQTASSLAAFRLIAFSPASAVQS
jgi:hypothetical protein